MDEVKDNLGMQMESVAPGEHESAAKQNNGNIEEWHHAAMHKTPFKSSPKAMIDASMTIDTQ